MDWWLWLLFGLALLVVELLTPGGFYFLFFGAGALLVGLLAAAGVATSAVAEWLAFAGGSIVALVLFRRPLLAYFRQGATHEVDSLQQQVAVLLEDLPPEGFGKAELRGTTWNARNAEARALKAGQRCRVERVDGLTLWLRAE
jgi:membrane protein implicated in regulation of membrane protease activity